MVMSKKTLIFLISIVLSACGGMPASTQATEQLGTPTSPSKADCSPPSDWTIEYNRTGGFGGFDQSLTLQSDGSLTIQSERPPLEAQMKIPEDHVEPITDLLVQACPFEAGPTEGVCADCFIYELNIQMNGQTYAVQASDMTLTEELHPLINALDEFLQIAGQ
jgi:hypothetical protein